MKGKCGMRNEGEVRSAECGVRNEGEVRNAECGVRSAECRSFGNILLNTPSLRVSEHWKLADEPCTGGRAPCGRTAWPPHSRHPGSSFLGRPNPASASGPVL